MSKYKAMSIIGEYLIDFGLALECEAVRAAIASGDEVALRAALESEF